MAFPTFSEAKYRLIYLVPKKDDKYVRHSTSSGRAHQFRCSSALHQVLISLPYDHWFCYDFCVVTSILVSHYSWTQIPKNIFTTNIHCDFLAIISEL
jgi:hypothetical protein